MKHLAAVIIMVSLIAIGCSGSGGNSVAPELNEEQKIRQAERSHYAWGLWQGIADPVEGTLDFIQLRTGDFHLNALPFLEPPALVKLTLDSLEFNGNIIDADIGLLHPFLGLNEFSGFDVCGILIANGSVTGFYDTGLRMAGEGDTRLLNADAYSRWWNPSEFPVNDGTIFGYTDGLLGAPDSIGNFNSTLNGCKYFCDDLTANDPMSAVTLANRGKFLAGQKNVRHFTIELGNEGLIFNYAIDASWMFPIGPGPWQVPDDFPPEANRPEAWNVVVTETNNTLYNDGITNGGNLSLQIDVYDWFNANLNTVRVESPSNFTMVESVLPTGGGEGYSTYDIEITSATPGEGEIEILIGVISEEQDFAGFIPGVNTTAYFTHPSTVATSSPLGFTLELDASYFIDGPYHDTAPGIITHPADDKVTIGYLKYTGVGSTTSDHVYSPDSGGSWVDPPYSTYGTGWGSPPQPADIVTSMGIDSDGNAYHLLNSLTSSVYSLLVKFVPQPPWYNCGIYVARSTYSNGLIFSNDGYAIIFGDYTNSITYKRNDAPNQPHPSSGWLGWQLLPQYTAISSPARLSRTKNIVRDSSNDIHVIYFSSSASDTWIRIASNSDLAPPAGWSTADVYNGSADGYDRARDPGIHLETDGDWHSAFILHTTDPSSTESIAYSRSTDGSSWTSPVLAFSTPGVDILNDPTVDVVEVGGQEIIVITYADASMIYLTFSWDAGVTWQETTLLSTGSDYRPEMCSTPDGYIHNVWEHDKGSDFRIEYIRGHFISD